MPVRYGSRRIDASPIGDFCEHYGNGSLATSVLTQMEAEQTAVERDLDFPKTLDNDLLELIDGMFGNFQ